MFTRIIDTLRNNSNNTTRYRDVPEINVERRSSTDDGGHVSDQLNPSQQRISSISTDAMPRLPAQDLSNSNSPTTPMATGMKRGTEALGIKHMDDLNDTVVYPDGRRRSSLFGYSTNAADDYMQKDLLSSSWS